MARVALLIAAFGLIAVSAISPASPQAPNLEKLASDIERHYEAGEYSDVLTLAREALPLAERQYGPEHERLLPILRTFGNSYYWLNRYEEAEPLLKRTLAIRESVNGPRDLKVAEAATELANVYYYWTGRAGDAAPLYRRAATIVEAARGPRHAATATAVQNLADTLAYLGQHPEAEPLSKRALAIREEVLGEHRLVAYSLNQLAWSMEELGRVREAEPILLRALELRERVLGAKHTLTAFSLTRLADNYQKQSRFKDAEPLYVRALAIREDTLGPEHKDVARVLQSLAILKVWQNNFAEAEPLLRRALTIREKADGPESAAVGQTLRFLAQAYHWQGREAEAVTLYKRALDIAVRTAGPKSTAVGESLLDLAGFLGSQDLATVQALYERALEIFSNTLGPDSAWAAASKAGLAYVHYSRSKYDLAKPLYQDALRIYEKVYGLEHPHVSSMLVSLANVYYWQGAAAEARALYERVLSIREKALGPAHYLVADALTYLGDIDYDRHQYDRAEQQYARSLSIYETSLGPQHSYVSSALNKIGRTHFRQGDWSRAVGHLQRSTDLVVKRERVADEASQRGPATTNRKSEIETTSGRFKSLIKASYRLGNQKAADLTDRMFRASQWALSSNAAVTMQQMAARSAKSDPRLSGLARVRQDLVAEWQTKDRLMVSARSGAATPPIPDLARRLTEIELQIADIDRTFATEFPEYAELVRAEPMSIAGVQRLLDENEALVAIVDTAYQVPLPEESFIWVVTKREVRWLRSEFGTATLRLEVAALRCGLDATAWVGEGATRCADVLKLPLDKVPKEGDSLPFDAARAHGLYVSLFGAARDLIKDKHLLLVPSGALTTLPFHVLLTEPGTMGLISAPWLIRDHPITILPSVASLAALRQTAKSSAATKPMIGFGNPLLDGDQAHPRHGDYYRRQAQIARAQTGCATSAQRRTAALRMIVRSVTSVPQPGNLADLDHLRRQAPLPETADEICEVARAVGGGDVWIGARATETEVKRLSSSGELAKYKIVHFATHGTLAGQLSGTNEPGLILSPPETPMAEDDGYLSGSEIAGLKLDAEWVILSACNTAGGAGQGETAEALSGLARVFFYAGARALLASHWEVDSDAAVKLVTRAVGALAKEPLLGRAEALRRAMLSTMVDSARPLEWIPAWHPSVWAPFVVVGEGGAGR